MNTKQKDKKLLSQNMIFSKNELLLVFAHKNVYKIHITSNPRSGKLRNEEDDDDNDGSDGGGNDDDGDDGGGDDDDDDDDDGDDDDGDSDGDGDDDGDVDDDDNDDADDGGNVINVLVLFASQSKQNSLPEIQTEEQQAKLRPRKREVPKRDSIFKDLMTRLNRENTLLDYGGIEVPVTRLTSSFEHGNLLSWQQSKPSLQPRNRLRTLVPEQYTSIRSILSS